MAYSRVLTHRKQRSRLQQRFQETTMEVLAQLASETSELDEARQKTLVRCMDKLAEGDRHLIQQPYLEG